MRMRLSRDSSASVRKALNRLLMLSELLEKNPLWAVNLRLNLTRLKRNRKLSDRGLINR